MSTPKDSEFLTAVECLELAETMEKKYTLALQGRKFQLEAEVKGRGVFVKITLFNRDKTFYYPVEARVLFEKEEMSKSEAALFLVDYIDNYFEDFLLEEDEAIYIPIDWTDYQYEAVNFQMRGQILNLKLETMADEWLKKAALVDE